MGRALLTARDLAWSRFAIHTLHLRQRVRGGSQVLRNELAPVFPLEPPTTHTSILLFTGVQSGTVCVTLGPGSGQDIAGVGVGPQHGWAQPRAALALPPCRVPGPRGAALHLGTSARWWLANSRAD